LVGQRRFMSPKNDNQEPDAKPDVTVDIPHDEKRTPSAPASAPPLPAPEPLPTRPINITDNVSTPPPVVPPISPAEFHEHQGRRWPAILMYLILALLVAALVVFAGRWIYRSATHQSSKTNKPASSNQSRTPSLPPATSQTPATGAGSTQSQTTGQPAANSQLPNNGPGDVVAIFIGTALAVGGLHFLYNLRKQN